MKEVLHKINELMSAVGQVLVGYEKGVKDRTDKLDLLAIELSTKDSSLSERESKLGRRENLEASERQVRDEKELAAKLLLDARKEKQAVETEAKAIFAEVDVAKKQTALNFEKSKNELLMIQGEWNGLKKEQVTWKAKFIEDIKKKVS